MGVDGDDGEGHSGEVAVGVSDEHRGWVGVFAEEGGGHGDEG